jgi:DNA-binding transcriptional regulator/RsmH inhibitor MraZ
MRKYVEFLNETAQKEQIDFDLIELFWVQKVETFFRSKPFTVKLDPSKGLRAVVRDVLKQAIERQHDSQGVTYAGAVLQHMVGAKLECAMVGEGMTFEHFSFTTSDSQTERAGDFLLGDVAIHVTTSPGEAVVRRCQENLDAGFRPIIVTLQKGLTVAEGLAANAGIADRLDVFEIEQFVALNLYELGKFKATGRRTAVEEMVVRYNAIIEEIETDPSLRIAIQR